MQTTLAIDAKKLVYDIIIQHMETIMDRPVGARGTGGAWHTKILADQLTNYLNQEGQIMPNNEPRQNFFVITSLEDINSLNLFVNKKNSNQELLLQFLD